MLLASRVASASAKLALSQASVRLLSLVTMPLLTHLLAPAAYGTAALMGTVVSLAAMVAIAGMDMSYMRTCTGTVGQATRAAEAFAWQFALLSALTAGLAAAAVWFLIAPSFAVPQYLTGFVLLAVLFSVANTMAQTRARLQERYWSLSFAIFVSGLGTVAVSLGAAFFWRRDEMPLVFSLVVGYLVPVLVLSGPSRMVLFSPSGLTREERFRVLRIGIAGMLTAPAYWVLSSSDRWILGHFEGPTSVGIYSVGYSVAIMGMMANDAVLAVWTPETVREYEDDPERARITLGKVAESVVALFACVYLAIAAAGGDVIRLLAAPAFHDAAAVVPLVAASVVFYGLYHLANATFLLMHRLSDLVRWWVAGGILSVAGNLLLVPHLGRVGAALTQAMTFGFIGVGTMLGAQRLYRLEIGGRRLSAVIAGVLAAGFVMSAAWSADPMTSLVLKFPVGVITALLILRMLAPRMMPRVMRALVTRLRGG
jgi:O-antigen/teichoic acid export membrane protein